MIWPFSPDYFPPIPVLEVWLAIPENNNWHGPFVAIVDTGADFTIVPMRWLRLLNPPVVRPAVLSSQWQDRHSVHIYEVGLRLDQIVLPCVDVAGDPFCDELLLGRNVLNRLDLRLNGPALCTHVMG